MSYLPHRDFQLEAAKGLIPEHSVINKFGRNTEIDSGVIADVYDNGNTGGQLIWLAPTAARIHTIASDSAQDDAGGTGTNSVKVYYLADWDTAEASETVTGNINGGIAMSNAAVMINRMKATPQATSTSPNIGTITATAAVDATVTAQINPGKGQTQMAIFGVPSIQKCYIGRFYGNMNRASGGLSTGYVNATLLHNQNPDVQTLAYLTRHTFGLSLDGTSALTINYYTPKIMQGPCIIKVQIGSSTANMDISAGFDAVLVDN